MRGINSNLGKEKFKEDVEESKESDKVGMQKGNKRDVVIKRMDCMYQQGLGGVVNISRVQGFCMYQWDIEGVEIGVNLRVQIKWILGLEEQRKIFFWVSKDK